MYDTSVSEIIPNLGPANPRAHIGTPANVIVCVLSQDGIESKRAVGRMGAAILLFLTRGTGTASSRRAPHTTYSSRLVGSSMGLLYPPFRLKGLRPSTGAVPNTQSSGYFPDSCLCE